VATDSPSNDGRRLYLTCSGSCHSPEPIRKYSKTEWEKIFPEMVEEANLAASKVEVLRSYIFGELAASPDTGDADQRRP
jgi:hypothetical protein